MCCFLWYFSLLYAVRQVLFRRSLDSTSLFCILILSLVVAGETELLKGVFTPTSTHSHLSKQTGLSRQNGIEFDVNAPRETWGSSQLSHCSTTGGDRVCLFFNKVWIVFSMNKSSLENITLFVLRSFCYNDLKHKSGTKEKQKKFVMRANSFFHSPVHRYNLPFPLGLEMSQSIGQTSKRKSRDVECKTRCEWTRSETEWKVVHFPSMDNANIQMPLPSAAANCVCFD